MATSAGSIPAQSPDQPPSSCATAAPETAPIAKPIMQTAALAIVLREVLTVSLPHQTIFLEAIESSADEVLAIGALADPGDILLITSVAPN